MDAEPGGAPTEPRADDQVVEPRSPRRRYRAALALARPAALVGLGCKIAAGHDVKTVADRLGHANAAITLRVYAHAFAASNRTVADSVGAALEGDA